MSDLFDDFASSKLLIDRSDLETCASCPMQMRLLQRRRRTVGTAANIGQEVHDAISKVVASYIDAGGMISRSDIADELTRNLTFTRPDVQAEAIDAARASVWAIARMLNETDPDAILRYDGGEGERSGQLAWDINADVRLTQELDLVRATESREVLKVDDWKSGRGFYDIEKVAKSFQFTEAGVLVFQNYPDVQRVDVTVWNLREGQPLPPVHFYRRKLPQYIGFLTTAVNAWSDNAEPVALENVAAWPSVEKCRLCDAAVDCPVAEREFKADPSLRAEQFVALEAKYDALKELLLADIEKNGGRPIETPAGDKIEFSFTDKPKRTFKVKAAKERDR